uniref:Uncharacterized protein n=1 Tax=Rhizophora mucronata TaxID=61149 RepID=A0A2P2P427_RHIMU
MFPVKSCMHEAFQTMAFLCLQNSHQIIGAH